MQYMLCIKVAASARGLHLHADEKPWLFGRFCERPRRHQACSSSASMKNKLWQGRRHIPIRREYLGGQTLDAAAL
jgi:hypothetical protein